MVIQVLSLVANLAYRKGDYPTAETRHREAAQLADQTFGPRHPDSVLDTHNIECCFGHPQK